MCNRTGAVISDNDTHLYPLLQSVQANLLALGVRNQKRSKKLMFNGSSISWSHLGSDTLSFVTLFLSLNLIDSHFFKVVNESGFHQFIIWICIYIATRLSCRELKSITHNMPTHLQFLMKLGTELFHEWRDAKHHDNVRLVW